ncbi:MAG: polyphosphate kinase [Candidatus Atribacteria bacterium]|nr:MAG: polyphosphate kinase [Candidatus Atribacteria bacterium]
MKADKYITINNDWDKKEIREKTKSILKEIGELQYKMYAGQKHSLLIVFQGLDASGKDGLTRGLLKYCNPIGIKIKSFKKPTPDEFAHDFLWRVHKEVPAKGDIQIFIRSHYEDILVPSVEGYYTKEMIDKRYGLINDFEKLLEHNNTRVLKFFLNVSLETQKERLMERIELEEKQWKHKDGDWETREKFKEYSEVYERILNECNHIPWHVVPADKNWQKLYFVANEVLKVLKSLNSQWPPLVSEKFKKE